MKKTFRYLLAFALISNLAFGHCGSCDDCCYDCDNCCLGACDAYPYLQIRSQGRDTARQMVGWQELIHKTCVEENYTALSLAVEYDKTFRNERLAQFYFGNDLVNCCELYIQGSDVADRNAKAWLADYFGLAPDFDSRLKFCPEIQNVIVDLDFYWGLDCWKEGFYVRVNAPIVWTKWELCPCERVIAKGTKGFEAGYMAEAAVERTKLVDSFMAVMNGSHTFGDMKSPLAYAKIRNCGCTKTRLAEIDFTFGWDFVQEEDHHFGAFLYVAAPAGNRPCGKYLFEPIVGNGNHWELGGGISGHWIFWRDCECEDRHMGLWLEATVAHLFRTCQTRTFDLCKKPSSRYMLLEEMEKNDAGVNQIIANVENNPVTPDYRYNKNLIPVANWSTFNVDVKIPVMADIAIKFGWVRDCWTFDLGYNLYARSGEKFCDPCCNTSKLYALKGDAFVYGYNEADTDEAFPLSATQSAATIHGGTNYPAQTTDAHLPSTNPRVDDAGLAFAKDTAAPYTLVDFAETFTVNTSKTPVLVNKDMLNMGKSPSSITHKLFANVSYTWSERECDNWTPFLGIGGKVEFAQDNWNDCCCCDSCCNDCCCTSNCNSCSTTKGCCCGDSSCGCDCCDDCCDCSRRGGLSQWGIWLKGGVTFD